MRIKGRQGEEEEEGEGEERDAWGCSAVRSIIISMFRLREGDIYTTSNGLKMSFSQSAG